MNNALFDLYQNEPNLKLLLIASDWDGSVPPEAVTVAESILCLRYNVQKLNLNTAWDEETWKSLDLDTKCSLCHNPDVEYSKYVYFCTPEESQINLKESIPGIISLVTVGIGYKNGKVSYRYVTGNFKLCRNCFISHHGLKNNGTPIIDETEYCQHPLYQYYSLIGFREIRHS